MQSDEQAIRDLMHTWLEASKANDTDACLSLLADDVVFRTVGQQPFGKEAFAAPGQPKLKIDPVHTVREVTVAGDMAYVVSHLAVTITPEQGESTKLSGYILTVFRKQTDGRWLLARDANLLMPN